MPTEQQLQQLVIHEVKNREIFQYMFDNDLVRDNELYLVGGDDLFSVADKEKLDGIEPDANKYAHPSSHPATMIVEDTTHRFVTDTEKNQWHTKAEGSHTHESGDILSILASRIVGILDLNNIPLIPIDKGGTGNSEGYIRTGTNQPVGQYATAEGHSNYAGGAYSHAEGCTTNASGERSHAEGYATTASGVNSHASGLYTTARADNSAIFGKYGETNEDTLFAVANGTSESDKNLAFEIKADGTMINPTITALNSRIAELENILNNIGQAEGGNF